MSKTYFFEHLGPDIEWAQSEAAGLALRIGNQAWVLGRYDYREKACPRYWPRISIVLGQRTYPWRKRLWKLRAFGKTFSNGGNA